jgi:hypothetical protein
MVVKARATTRVTILRGETAPDEYLDTNAALTPAYTGIPASIIERTQHMFSVDYPNPTIVRYVTGRVGAETDIQENDRILDEWTGVIYAIDDSIKPNSPVNSPDIRMNLKQVT